MNTKIISTLLIRMILLFAVFASGCTADIASEYAAGSAETLSDESSGHAEQVKRVGVDLSQALANGKPILIFFTPVEICQIQYCTQPQQVAQALEQHYPEPVNLVVAPVYAIDTSQKPLLPMVDWPVYLVEPYATWVPEMIDTQFGWGLDAPQITFVDASGHVLYRSGASFTLQEVADILADQHS